MRLFLLLAVALVLPAQAQPLKEWKGGATSPLELKDVEGRLHRLSDYRGKVVLVNFWATWCAPCREEMPSMQALRDSLQGRPFEVLAVNVGEGARVARGFGDKMALRFPLLLDGDTSTTRAWGARVLPANFVIAPDGRIRYSHLGALDWARADVKAAIERLMP